MNTAFILFFRGGEQLHTSKLNGFPLVTFGDASGFIGNAACFESVTIATGGKRQRVVTEDDFDGPVSICVVTKGRKRQWFGLATASTIARVTESV